jgi:hypothetical protein
MPLHVLFPVKLCPSFSVSTLNSFHLSGTKRCITFHAVFSGQESFSWHIETADKYRFQIRQVLLYL